MMKMESIEEKEDKAGKKTDGKGEKKLKPPSNLFPASVSLILSPG
jgi:hypothetical protein